MQNMEEIYEQYSKTVNKYLFCLTHDSDISEELTQETFYKAIKKIGTYRGECKMAVWLCQIAKNLWYDYCRKNKRIVNEDQMPEMISIFSLYSLLAQSKTLMSMEPIRPDEPVTRTTSISTLPTP